jgi:hypothetical protein
MCWEQRGLKGKGYTAEEVAQRAGHTAVHAWLHAYCHEHRTNRRARAQATLMRLVEVSVFLWRCAGWRFRRAAWRRAWLRLRWLLLFMLCVAVALAYVLTLWSDQLPLPSLW